MLHTSNTCELTVVQGKCELKRENDFNRTNPDASCNCVEKIGEAGNPSDVGFRQVIVLPFGSESFEPALSGCCTGPAGYAVRRAFDLAACLRMCDDDAMCVGAEYSRNVQWALCVCVQW